MAPVGYFFDVITNGFGVMPDYRAQITGGRPLADRRLRARAAAQPPGAAADVPAAELERLKSGEAAAPAQAKGREVMAQERNFDEPRCSTRPTAELAGSQSRR